MPLRLSVPVFEFAQEVVTCGEMDPPSGAGITVTVTLAVFVHPFPPVPVTVYVVVDAGLAITVAPVVDDSPEAGPHE